MSQFSFVLEQKGNIAAFLTAVFWSASVILFRISCRKTSVIDVNRIKNWVGSLLLILTMVVVDLPMIPDEITGGDWVLFAASGFLGIVVGDTFFLYSLHRLGAISHSVLDCVYAPTVFLLSHFYLGDVLGVRGIVGGLMVLLAVFLVSRPDKNVGLAEASGDQSRVVKAQVEFESTRKAQSLGTDWTIGILLGILGVLAMAVAIVMIKPALGRVPLLWACTWRFTFATLVLSLWDIVKIIRTRRQDLPAPVAKGSFSHWKTTVPAAFFGSYIASMTWVYGFRWSTTTQAAFINQLSAVFIILWAGIFLKEKLTLQRGVAVVVAFFGAVLVATGR